MKVDILVPVGEKGGVENVINDTVPYLQEQGISVRIVQLVWEEVPWVLSGIPFYPLIKGKDGHCLAEFIQVYKDFLLENGVPDCILATSWPSMCYVAKRVIGELHLLRTMVISWLHAPVKRYVDAGFGGYEHLKMADAHFAISEDIREDLLSHFADTPISKIYNPVDFARCMKAKSSLATKEKHKLYFVGRVSEEKRLDVILQGIAVTNGEWELHIIGDDDNKHGTNMKELARKLGIQQDVHWYGWHNSPWEMVDGADAVVLASEYEGFPLTAIEAQANGIPVVSTPVSGIKELIQDGVNGYIFPFGNWKMLGQVLCRIADNSFISSEICKSKVEVFEKEAAIRDFHEKLMNLYEEWHCAAEQEEILSEEERTRQIEQIKQDRTEWMDKVFAHLHSARFEVGKELFYKVLIPDGNEVNQYWLDDTSAILDVMFKIYDAEKEHLKITILHRLKSVDYMKQLYYELRYLVRRFEYDLPMEQKEELLPFVARHHISGYAIVEFVKNCVTDKEKVLNEIAVFMIGRKRYQCVLPLLTYATDINPYHMETLYNLSYFLYLCDEKETALQYGAILKDEMPDAARLYDIMAEGTELPPYEELHQMQWRSVAGPRDIRIPEQTQKISFITCVNDERQYQECCYYIDNLVVPEGYEIEKIAVRGAEGMTSGYQQAMSESDAKYKVYLHQSAYCRNRYFLYEALEVFEQDTDVGIIGVAGAVSMPESGVWWNSEEEIIYSLYQDSIAYYGCQQEKPLEETYKEMEALDGVFLMTSRDVDWRQDIFDGWHLYDASQTKEFLRAGYKAVIARQEDIWVLHCEKCQMYLGHDYEEARQRYVKEYLLCGKVLSGVDMEAIYDQTRDISK